MARVYTGIVRDICKTNVSNAITKISTEVVMSCIFQYFSATSWCA